MLYFSISKFRKLITMKRIITLLILSVLSISAFSQSYMGWTNKQVNFREGPGTEYGIISSLQGGTQLFIISLETEYDFYNVIDIETNKTGYINKSFVKLGEELPKNEEGIFTPSGETESYNPEIEIYNKTNKTLTLVLNSTTYTFSPNEKKKLTLSPGKYEYRASAPRVIPDYGSEFMKNNISYSWTFYI